MDTTIDKALDHLGLYNSVAILMTGLIAEAVFYTEIYLCHNIMPISSIFNELISTWDHTWFGIISVLIGYLLGMLLNSWSGFFHYILKRLSCWDLNKRLTTSDQNSTSVNNRIIKLNSFELKDPHNIILWNLLVGKNHTLLRGCSITDLELIKLLNSIKDMIPENGKATITDLYQYCKQKLSPQSARYILQQQSIAAMCRSLGFFFILTIIISTLYFVHMLYHDLSIPPRFLFLTLINSCMAITMWLRNERFVRLRYITILRAGIKTEKI